MLNKSAFIREHPDLRDGMKVEGVDGANFGKVQHLGEDSLTVEKGFFFPKDFTFRYDDILELRDGSVIVRNTKADLEDWSRADYSGWSQVEDINAGRVEARPKDEYRDRYSNWVTEENRIPVVEEKLEARKTMEQAGEIRLRKVTHTELKHFTVPVLKEEVRVERVPVSESSSAAATAATGDLTGAFKDETVTIPIREEKVEITKTPEVKEEIRVSKEQHVEEREVEGEVRKEEVEIDRSKEERRKAV